MNKAVKNIWIIDDDKLYTLLLTKTFAKLDVCDTVTAYDNGKDAIDALKELHNNAGEIPELIFLDINMSVMDGWEFMEEYKQLKDNNGVSTVIYVASSSISTDDMKKARAHDEIHDYIVKPINSATVIEIVNKINKIGVN